VVVAAAIPMLFAYWHLVETILASPRGFELTDESLYLLAAREVAGTKQWGFPWGWHTAPLMAVVGGDIAQFRTLGGFLLGLAGAATGVITYLALERNVAVRSIFTERKYLQWNLVFFFTGLATSFLYYQALVRAPSYNWVNLMGLLVATSGALLLYRFSGSTSSFVPQGWSTFALLLVAVGLVYSSTGKPSSPVFALAAFFVAWVVALGAKKASMLVASALLATILILIILLITGLWPRNFLDIFILPLSSVGLTGNGVLSAVADVLRVPQDFVGVLLDTHIYAGITVVTPVVGALLLWALSFLFPRRKSLFQLLAVGLMAISSLWVFGLVDWVANPLEPQQRWVQPEVPAGFILIFIFVLLIAVTAVPRSAPSIVALDIRRGIEVAIPLLALPLIYGFGSGNGAFRQSGMASIGYALATMAVAFALHRRFEKSKIALKIGISGIFLVFSLLAGAVLSDSYAKPYRIKSIAEQVHPAQVGASELLVDASTLEYIEDLSRVSTHEEWNSDTTLVGLSWSWNAAEAVVLDGRTPSSLMLTLWGYPGAEKVAIENIFRQEPDFQWSEAWLVVDSVGVLGEEEAQSIQNVLVQIETESGFRFPEDYELVSKIDSHPLQGPIEIYRPSSR
jgi:hypothetical protein